MKSYNRHHRKRKDNIRILQAIKFENLEEMDKFLEIHNLPRVNQEELKNLNRPITDKSIERVIINRPKKQKSSKHAKKI